MNLEGHEYAVRTVSLIISYCRRVQNELSTSSHEIYQAYAYALEPTRPLFRRVARNVTMRLEDMERKLDGDRKNCWSEHDNSYQQIDNSYKLTME